VNNKKDTVIFFIETLESGGAQKVCLTLAQVMQSHGYSVYILILDESQSSEMAKTFYSYNIPIISLYDETFESSPRFLNKLKYRKYGSKFEQALQKIESNDHQIKLIMTSLIGAYRTCKHSTRSNIYYWLHSPMSFADKLHIKSFQIVVRKLIKLRGLYNNQNIISVSKGISDDLINKCHIKPKSIRSIYNPVDINTIKRLSEKYDPDIPSYDYVICVARICGEKNLSLLIQAFSLLKTKAHLIILGEGDDKHTLDLTDEITRLKLNKKIHLVGFKQNPYPWINQAKALALSSSFEGLPTVLIESLVCNTIPVSTDCPVGPREILLGPFSEFLAKENPKDLANKLNLALSSEISNEEFEAHYKKFTKEAILEEYIKLIKTHVEQN
jgi:glycosyltransferase involved in cell wall biosynthesis